MRDIQINILLPVQLIVEYSLQLTVKRFEKILKQKFNQSAWTFHSFIPIVVAIVQLRGIVDAIDELFHH